jgi:hypothetical protein
MPRPFLTAVWRNLILAHYPVPDELLVPLLPAGLEPDRRDGRCWVSLVGFQFLRTRVFGVGWPGFRDFPEWNLRAYVRRGDQRGVFFVREFVRSRFVAWTARRFYNEPYLAVPMAEEVSPEAATYRVLHGNRWHELHATVGGPPSVPPPDSADAFFIDQSWGFGRTRRGAIQQYAVEHPPWAVYPVAASRVGVDWPALYGPAWSPLAGVAPAAVTFVVGSAVAVYPANRGNGSAV